MLTVSLICQSTMIIMAMSCIRNVCFVDAVGHVLGSCVLYIYYYAGRQGVCGWCKLMIVIYCSSTNVNVVAVFVLTNNVVAVVVGMTMHCNFQMITCATLGQWPSRLVRTSIWTEVLAEFAEEDFCLGKRTCHCPGPNRAGLP